MDSLMYLVKCGDEDAYNLFYCNGKHLGLIYKEIDGYYVVNTSIGFSEAAEYRWIADKLDEMNQPWHDVVMSDPQLNPDWEAYLEHIKQRDSQPQL